MVIHVCGHFFLFRYNRIYPSHLMSGRPAHTVLLKFAHAHCTVIIASNKIPLFFSCSETINTRSYWLKRFFLSNFLNTLKCIYSKLRESNIDIECVYNDKWDYLSHMGHQATYPMQYSIVIIVRVLLWPSEILWRLYFLNAFERAVYIIWWRM